MNREKTTNIIIIALMAILVTIMVVATTTAVCAVGRNPEKLSKEELTEVIAEQQYIKDNAHTMAESARVLGWENNDRLIKKLQIKWDDANKIQEKHQEVLDKKIAEELEAARIEAERVAAEEAKRKAAEEARWANRSSEYPAATTIWRYMKNLGWNDYVCAGILGNIMAEVGGQTLDIRYTLSSSGYYGMCQWGRGYSQVWGAGLETQCDFLRDTIKYEIDTYGSKYQSGFNFNSFLNMTDAKQAALAFAKSYERCSSASYGVRQNNAIKAYNYFVN